MHQATVDQLRTLRLLGMVEAWQEQQTTPTYHDLSFDERFSLLVERGASQTGKSKASKAAEKCSTGQSFLPQ